MLDAMTVGPVRHILQSTTTFEPIEVPSLSIIRQLKIESENDHKYKLNDNLDAKKRGIDTPDGNLTSMFGPHLITKMESVLIHEQGFIYGDIVHRALEYATEDFSFTTSHQTSAFTTKTKMDPTSMLTDTTIEIGPTSMLTDTTEITTTPGTTVTQTTQFKKRRKKRSIKKILSETDRKQIDQFISKLPDASLLDLPCPFTTTVCNETAKYRTIDGSCNNLEHPYWGKSFTPFDRFLKAEYQDASQSPRILSKLTGNALEGPREISNFVHTTSTLADIDPAISSYMMTFGQFLDHDITKTALAKGAYPFNLDCCNTNRPNNSDCFPFTIPGDDPYHRDILQSNRRCMNFVRSVAACDLGCNLGYREQINELTHYIDGSSVYGSTVEELDALKDPTDNGMMLVSMDDKLPLDDSDTLSCTSDADKTCFRAGDVRANTQPALSSLHTIWVREHNRIAQHFKNSPECYNWTGQQIFEETRRYVAAEIQHVTYNEFLPKLLSVEIREQFGLVPLLDGHFTGYDSTVRPMIRNSFSSAAYRMGHSLIRDKFAFPSSAFDLHVHLNKPDLLYEPSGIERCTRGMYENPAQTIDEKMTREITWKLFETIAGNGGDLAAFNIQRGRDHGLPSYTTWLHWCTNKTVQNDNFNPGVEGGLFYHSAAAATKLGRAYSYTCDIELFPGGISEEPLPGSRLGPTFTCILALQFRALKYGDRFFYEGNTPLNPHPFTPQELEGFRPITMAKIICENTNIEQIPRDVFLEPSESNPLVNCSDLPDICFPKNGGWSDWKDSCCSNCCTRQQYRSCDNPPPNECGKPCEGYDFRYKSTCHYGGGCCHYGGDHHDGH
ncbi:salivary peroxidase/catechol oxidase-like [Mytilus edulis]|uniref:salivary peroxidase/catechol oxidase-like n=1 Tax=Mytilus edulis TaxID=6550 RepID=UPI0039F0D524